MSHWEPAGQRRPVLQHDAHVWRVQLDDASLLAQCTAVLTDDERHRATRFHAKQHQVDFALTHGALRMILAAYLGCTGDQIRFSNGPHGKPFLAPVHESSLQFNLSHSGRIALIALANDRAVGVDIQRWHDDMEYHDVARLVFSPREIHQLRNMEGDTRIQQAFFTTWTRKEAYVKAIGTGMTYGLDRVEVTMCPDEPPVLILDAHDAEASLRWCMRDIECASEYSSTLVVRAPLDEIFLYDFSGHPR